MRELGYRLTPERELDDSLRYHGRGCVYAVSTRQERFESLPGSHFQESKGVISAGW